MTYFRAWLFDKKKDYWLRRSKRLFKKYGKLSLFTYEGTFDMDLNFIGDNYIIVSGNHNPSNKNGNDSKTYYVVDTKKEYYDLKKMLDLEIKIRYPNS